MTVCVASLSISAAWADATTSSAPTKKASASHLSMMPKAIAGFCAGVVVGTPICFARKLSQEMSEGAHGLAGSIKYDTKNKFLIHAAGLVWLPAAGIVSLLEAPGYAIKDAWMAEEPFSKDQFSLGQLDKLKPAIERAEEEGQSHDQK
jgi:hypothetical protein